jgi:hypothetical protein
MSKLSDQALIRAVLLLRRECINTPLDAAAKRAHERVVARIQQHSIAASRGKGTP